LASARPPSIPDLPIHELLALEAVSRLGSVQAAADALNVTPSGVSHRIASLERRVHASLLQRKGRGVGLTDAAQAYVDAVRPAMVALTLATDELRAHEHGALRIATAAAVGTAWLLPRLREYARERPTLRYEIRTVATADEVGPDRWDLMVHYGDRPQRGSLRQLLFHDPLIRVCAPGLLRPKAKVLRPDESARLPVLRLAQLDSPGSERAAGSRRAAAAPAAQLVFDDALSMLEAAAAGAGVALTTATAAALYLDSGRLVHATAEAHAGAPYWLDLSEAGQFKAAAKNLFRWLATRAAATANT